MRGENLAKHGRAEPTTNQPTYGIHARIWTWEILVGGKWSHHAALASLQVTSGTERPCRNGLIVIHSCRHTFITLSELYLTYIRHVSGSTIFIRSIANYRKDPCPPWKGIVLWCQSLACANVKLQKIFILTHRRDLKFLGEEGSPRPKKLNEMHNTHWNLQRSLTFLRL